MKIYDCTTFYNEKMLFELRLNILEKYVHKFIVVESLYSHSGLKKELLKIPVFGWHLKKINSIAIERNTTTKENLGFIDNIINIINNTKRPLLIFPQGTRTPAELKIPFKKGVGRIYELLKMRCLPIALNSGNVWPKNGRLKTDRTIIISILEPILTV